MHKFLWIIVGTIFTTACSLLSPVKTDCIKEYIVDSIPQVYSGHGTSLKTVAVALPTTSAVYASKEMAYSTETHGIDYFAKNRWAATPAQMLQPLLIQTLQNTHHFKAVAPSSGVGRYDLHLNTQIFKFHQEFCGRQSIFKLTVRAQLVVFGTGKVIASKEFSVVESAPYLNPYGGVMAANRATAKMLSELAAWAVLYH